PYFTMELVAGRPLGKYVRHSALALPQQLELFRGVCEAIASAHQRGVIHRDVKPSNIMVDDAGRPKVLDFGLAKLLENPDGETAASWETEAGRIQGTLPYMSPEQVRGDSDDIDVRSD